MRSIDEQVPVSLFSQRCIATVLFGSSFRAGVFGETNLGDQGLLRRGPPSSPKAGPFERRFYHFETSLGKFCTFLTKYGVFRFGLELAKMPENGIFCFSRAYLDFSYVGIFRRLITMKRQLENFQKRKKET